MAQPLPPVAMALMDELVVEMIHRCEATADKKEDIYRKVEMLGFKVGASLFEW